VFRRKEHINVLEATTVTLAIQRAVRSRKRRNCRVLVFLDNQAALGAFRKGRSSSWGMLMACRRTAAQAIFAGLRIAFRFVPTDRNPADGPSRGYSRPGVAPSPAPRERAPPLSCALGAGPVPLGEAGPPPAAVWAAPGGLGLPGPAPPPGLPALEPKDRAAGPGWELAPWVSLGLLTGTTQLTLEKRLAPPLGRPAGSRPRSLG